VFRGPSRVSVAKVHAGVEYGRLHAKADASANVAKAEAGTNGVVGDLLSTSAGATFMEAHAGAQVNAFGAEAKAHACVGEAHIGIRGTPLQAHAKGPGADAQAVARLDTLTLHASAGAYVGEVAAGPFEARLGVKVGIGFKNGMPVVDLGPVSGPCSIM